MVTYENVGTAHTYHVNGTCKVIVGPRGGTRTECERYRPNGRVQTWKTRPGHFRLPVKYGLRGPYGAITHENGHEFHRANDCPAGLTY